MRCTKPDHAGVAGGEQLILAAIAAVPDRSHRVDHVPCRQTIASGNFGISGGAATKRAAFGKQLRAGRAVNSAVDAATAQQRRIRGVDDGVNAERGDVGNDDFKPDVADLARSQNSGNRVDRDALVGKQLLQFAGLEHLTDDVAAADEFALDVKLRNGRPVRI